MKSAVAALFGAALLAFGPPVSAQSSEPALSTPWIKDHASSVRLVAGGVSSQLPDVVYAGLDIKLEPGWKTYWRNPGSSGVPPRVEFKGSENLASAELQFPAPQRFPDKEGDTIGYKSAVVLPLVIRAQVPGKPVILKVSIEYGVCKDVCIPVQADLALTLPPEARSKSGGVALAEAVARVPAPAASAGSKAPNARSIKVDLAAAKPSIVIEADFPGDAKGADAFLEAPDGLWIPLAKALDASGAVRRFHVDLTDGADLGDLKGKNIRLTLVSASGQSETSFKME